MGRHTAKIKKKPIILYPTIKENNKISNIMLILKKQNSRFTKTSLMSAMLVAFKEWKIDFKGILNETELANRIISNNKSV